MLLEQDALEPGAVHDMTVQAMRWMGTAVYENAVDVALDAREDEMLTFKAPV
ncbi:hypothetical protein [Bifidobacterium gallicum]|uniref:Uncharacterized protein n=1 Tax=Bifidobacterium gallicum DSM 20093 = LMG 11596 TaxID=561180 RepID=D1NVQ8_9BIFI|nr:hypothetical protein [Bifidobacterium gallicum]EFA22909.1 hypothetical protein BIFGAL_03950 [Bifidobacterium gallicum DSM 20093 = LMG 11596]KFI59392.1 hypothetical protein BGLCM_0502 [Bifidobacterium gallicum DSM 20093 = LMG 11596]